MTERVIFSDGSVGYQQGGNLNLKNKELPVQTEEISVSQPELHELIAKSARQEAVKDKKSGQFYVRDKKNGKIKAKPDG